MAADSRNAQEASSPPLLKVTTEEGFSAAQRSGIEWHHLAGHHGSRIVIGVYGESWTEQHAAIREADEEAKAAKREAKKAGKPTSKAAAWRWLEANRATESEAAFRLPVKSGKYGWFVPGFGEPDEVWQLGEDAADALQLIGRNGAIAYDWMVRR